MTTGSFDDQVHAFLLALVKPERRREPRVADRLQGIEPETVTTPAGPVVTWRIGAGPTVLLVHGWEDDNSLWSPLIDELADRGIALVAFDLPAHGASGGEWGLGFEGTDAVRAVFDARGPIDAVVAHSFGAGCASLAMGEGLAVPRAVFVAPPLRTGNRWQRYAERLGASPEVAAEAERIYSRAHSDERARWNPRTALPQLEVDLLVVHSTDDERNPFEDSQAVVAEAPRAQLMAVNELSHRRTARDPVVIARIADFVAST